MGYRQCRHSNHTPDFDHLSFNDASQDSNGDSNGNSALGGSILRTGAGCSGISGLKGSKYTTNAAAKKKYWTSTSILLYQYSKFSRKRLV